jgi:TonB family protein
LLQDDSNCQIVKCKVVQVPTITPEQMHAKSNVVRPATIEILTDTQGVDFGPYVQQVVRSVQAKWFELIPAVARKPQTKQGTVTIEFAILDDGRVSGMKLEGPSGDMDLDRAAWYGITQSNPFAPLPAQFHGKYLGLRFRFSYKPDANTSSYAISSKDHDHAKHIDAIRNTVMREGRFPYPVSYSVRRAGR